MSLKAISIILLSLFVVAAPSLFNEDYSDCWSHFKVKFRTGYQGSEDGARRLIFEHNARMIAKHNLEATVGVHSYTLGLYSFADKTPEEVQKERGCSVHTRKHRKSIRLFHSPHNVQLASSVDWREKGYVTPVKNQEQCGSCWAFATTGALEGQLKATTGDLVPLSEQNLVDCSRNGNQGCNGGIPDVAFEYVKTSGGIDTEESYPYEGRDDTCRFNKSSIGATCTGYVDIPSGNETALQAAVATIGPISVAIDASSQTFQMYNGGVYDNCRCSSTNLNHAVLVVGYGTQDGKDYWIVKNSWGTSWGMDGYILMSRNKNNQCGIATQASYPLM